MQGASVLSAELAAVASYKETARAIMGAKRNAPVTIPSVVGRLIKQCSADTMLQNARRDGAQFAWIPSGDSCSFCAMLASNGWRNATKKTIKGDHADHIHNHCKCEFCIRLDGKSTVQGYDPEKLKQEYDEADGDSWQEKYKSMRRDRYAKNKDKINVQKRVAYARRNPNNKNSKLLRIPQISASTITEKVKKGEYSLKYSQQQYDKHAEGTRDFERYKKSRISKGKSPQSVLLISKEEAEKIVQNQSGTGIIRVRRDGTAMNIEQISCNKVIGRYWNKGEWHDTNKAAIHYGKHGAHLVPIKGNHYD